MIVDGYEDDMNPKGDQIEVSNTTPTIQSQLSKRMKDSAQRTRIMSKRLNFIAVPTERETNLDDGL